MCSERKFCEMLLTPSHLAKHELKLTIEIEWCMRACNELTLLRELYIFIRVYISNKYNSVNLPC